MKLFNSKRFITFLILVAIHIALGAVIVFKPDVSFEQLNTVVFGIDGLAGLYILGESYRKTEAKKTPDAE